MQVTYTQRMKAVLTFLCLALTTNVFSQAAENLALAWDAYNSDRFEQCLATLDEVRGAESLFLQANCHQKLGDCYTALGLYNSAESSGCSHENLHLNRGICRLTLGMIEPAEQDLKRHLRSAPQHERALYYLAQLEYMRFAGVASMNYLDRCLGVNPDNTDALYLQGGNYVDQERYPLAADAFREVLSIDPEHFMAQKALAQVLLYEGQASEALALLEVLESDDNDVQAELYFYQAEAHYLLHQRDLACEFWDKSASMGDKDAARNHTTICEKGKDKLRRKRLTRMEL